MKAATVFIRHLSLHEVHLRQRAQNDRELGRHNAGVVEQLQLEPRPPLRDQVLEQFDPTTRRLAR